MDFSPGVVVGRYQLVRRLGAGGMGEIYEARHVDLGKRVAIKTLLPAMAQRAEVRERFMREGTAAAKIDHPHVVTVLDVILHEDVPCLVMEYLDGEDLAAHLEASGAMPVEAIARTMIPVLAAVAAAHREGIVHRDLKPPNIFLHRTRDGVVQPKVLDFGISKITGGAPLTGSASLLGTPQYMPPEQVESTKHVDGRADQYALGVILYQCATGRTPFEGEALLALVTAIIAGRFPRPRELRPELPPDFEAAILRAMATRADDRFPDVSALARALLPFADEVTARTWRPVFFGEATPPAQALSAEATASTLAASRNSVLPTDPAQVRVALGSATRAPETLEGATRPVTPPRRNTALGVVGLALGLAVATGVIVLARSRSAPEAAPTPAVAAPAPTPRPADPPVAAPTPVAPVAAPPPVAAIVVDAAVPQAIPSVAAQTDGGAIAPERRHRRRRREEREDGTNAMPIL